MANEIVIVEVGTPGPPGAGITTAEKNALAPKASPTFTGTVVIPTATITTSNVTTLNVSGVATMDGNVNIGNATSDTHTITGHLNFAGSLPTLTVGAAIGSTGTATFDYGNDTRGCIKFTPGGTGITSGVVFQLNFNVARANAFYTVLFSAADSDAAGLSLWSNQAGQSNTTFSVRSNTVVVSGTEYRLNYWIVE